MQSTERRWAYYYDFNLKPFPEDAPQFDFDEVLDKVWGLWKNQKAVHKFRNGEVTLRIKDMEFTDEYAMLLINISDVKATDPAFSNIVTGNVRVEEKQDDEGIGAACHVLFSRKRFKDKAGWHLSLIEEVVGIPKSTIQSFLNHVFKLSCKTEYRRPNEPKKKTYVCRPMADFAGHASETLKKSLKDSVLYGVTLLNHEDNQYIDDEKSLRLTEKVMRIKATEQPKGNAAIQALKRLRKYGQDNGFNEVRVQYTEVVAEEKKKNSKGEVKKREIKKQRTVNFDSKKEDFAEMVFTKSELIELTNEIGQCENKIHKELSRKMKKLIRSIET